MIRMVVMAASKNAHPCVSLHMWDTRNDITSHGIYLHAEVRHAEVRHAEVRHAEVRHAEVRSNRPCAVLGDRGILGVTVIEWFRGRVDS